MSKQKRLLTISFVVVALMATLFMISSSVWAAATKGPYWTEKDASARKSVQSKIDAMNEIFVNIVDSYSSAVVTVLTTSEVKVPQMVPDDVFEFFFGSPGGGNMQGPRMPRSQKSQSLGSGFVISPDGIIVTNSHVVRLDDEKLADSVKVKFLGDSSKSEGIDVEVVGIDPIVDTAVLRVKGKLPHKLTVIPVGNSDNLRVGEWVMAIGNPHGLSNTVTKGIVSALGRDIIPEVSADFIQTDASINQGNSGGPLLNLYGEVIGINTAIDPHGQGLGFAIPSNTAKRAIKAIMERGHASHGYAGVSLDPNFDLEAAKALGLKNTDGALIGDVMPGQPAARAGLRSHDVVTKIGGRHVNTNSDFQKAVRELEPNTTVNVEYIREGKTATTPMTLGDLDKGMQIAANGMRPRGRVGRNREAPTETSRLERAGIEVANLTNDIRNRWRLSPEIKGVVVAEVIAESPAEEAGLARGDILTEVQKRGNTPAETQTQKITDTKSVERAFARKGTYDVKVLRGNTLAMFTMKVI